MDQTMENNLAAQKQRMTSALPCSWFIAAPRRSLLPYLARFFLELDHVLESKVEGTMYFCKRLSNGAVCWPSERALGRIGQQPE